MKNIYSIKIQIIYGDYLFDFLKIDEDFWEFPFYSGNPKISKTAWAILAIAVLFELSTIIGLLAFLPLQEIPLEILSILPCIILLLALAYACKGKLGMFFKMPTLDDVKLIILFYILNMAYSLAMIFVLEALGVPTAPNSALPQQSIYGVISNDLIMLVALMEEELFKVILLILLMAAIYFFTKNKKTSVVLAVILNLIIFGLCHLSAYNGNVVQCIVVIGLGSFFTLFVYLKTKNIVNSYIVHVLYDFLFSAIGFLFSLNMIGLF